MFHSITFSVNSYSPTLLTLRIFLTEPEIFWRINLQKNEND
ncbi:hypothetical protein PG5_06610 [Pseudomonas sp. G5(2012)]|nr:hypothetical protein PG5_06610 [Pseudomonas sp. G5(2012)]